MGKKIIITGTPVKIGLKPKTGSKIFPYRSFFLSLVKASFLIISRQPYTVHRALLLHSIWCLFYGYFSWPVWKPMVEKWVQSGTYSYGPLVLGMVIILLYQRRHTWISGNPAISRWGFIAILVFFFLFSISNALQFQFGMQFSAVGMLISSVPFFWGLNYFHQNLFPCLFLWMAVPMGHALIPFFQTITLKIIHGFLHILSIPVWIEGFWLETHFGRFEVGPACSGIRYILASIALLLFYGELKRLTIKWRLILVMIGIAVATLSNGLRAVCIILLSAYTGQYYAIGVDHYLYGWLFFGLIALVFVYFLSKYPILDRRVGKFPMGNEKCYPLFLLGITMIGSISMLLAGNKLFSSRPFHSFWSLRFLDFQSTQGMDKPWLVYYPNAKTITKNYQIKNLSVTMTMVLDDNPISNRALVQYTNKPYDPMHWIPIEDRIVYFKNETYRLVRIKQNVEEKQILMWYCTGGWCAAHPWKIRVLQFIQWLQGYSTDCVAFLLTWDCHDFETITLLSSNFRSDLENKFKL